MPLMQNHEFLQVMFKEMSQGTDLTVEQCDFLSVWIKTS